MQLLQLPTYIYIAGTFDNEELNSMGVHDRNKKVVIGVWSSRETAEGCVAKSDNPQMEVTSTDRDWFVLALAQEELVDFLYLNPANVALMDGLGLVRK
jgi:hypothetical protein